MPARQAKVTNFDSGGSILSQILSSPKPSLKQLFISALVRKQEQAELLASKGVNPIIFKDLEEAELLIRAGSEHDIVIYAANGFHAAAPQALIQGLGERKKVTGMDVYFILVSERDAS